ncbi:hypothetical protein MRX96_037786 [Rhipicephalus microplus]
MSNRRDAAAYRRLCGSLR